MFFAPCCGSLFIRSHSPRRGLKLCRTDIWNGHRGRLVCNFMEIATLFFNPRPSHRSCRQNNSEAMFHDVQCTGEPEPLVTLGAETRKGRIKPGCQAFLFERSAPKQM